MNISLLVPFRANGTRDTRIKSWNWIERKWRSILPEAELCVGTDTGQPFSKSVAVNDAYRKSTGDMLVIADADSWVERPALDTALASAAAREHLVVPWWTAYRLHKEDSRIIMDGDPAVPYPVTQEMKNNCAGEGPSPASAAMVLCIQRVSYERVGGFDPRFRGWGSEDVSFGYACWTLLGRNEYCLGESYALYHPAPTNKKGMRVWKGDKGEYNMPLYERYRRAQGNPQLMAAICAQHPIGPTPIGKAPTWNGDDMVGLPEMDVNHPPPQLVATEPLFVDGNVTI